MQPATNFRDLIVWRKAHQYALTIYQLTAGFPKQETYGLAAQMRGAAVSAAANIAEGFGKRGKADKARFMNIAEGSIEESRYYLVLTNDLRYGHIDGLMKHLEEVSRLLTSYCKAIRNSTFEQEIGK